MIFGEFKDKFWVLAGCLAFGWVLLFLWATWMIDQMTTRKGNAAMDHARKQFARHAQAQDELESLRTRAELERAKRAARRRRRLLMALEIAAGALCAALVIVCAVKLCLMLAR